MRRLHVGNTFSYENFHFLVMISRAHSEIAKSIFPYCRAYSRKIASIFSGSVSRIFCSMPSIAAVFTELMVDPEYNALLILLSVCVQDTYIDQIDL